MTAEGMLKLYQGAIGEAKNLWETLLLPEGVRRGRSFGETAGAVQTARIEKRAGWGEVLPGAANRGMFLAAMSPALPRRPANLWGTGVLQVGQQGELPGTAFFAAERPGRRHPAETPEKAVGHRLRESVLAEERTALLRVRNAESGGNDFGTFFAEFERRLAIELGAG